MSLDYLVLLPILIPLTGAMVAVLIRKHHRLQAGLSLVSMLLSFGSSIGLLVAVVSGGEPLVYQLGGWRVPFGVLLVGDSLAVIFVLMTQLVMVMGIVYALGSQDTVVRYPTFYPLFLALGTGLTGAMLTGDLFTMFVFAELLVVSGTVLVALSDHRYGPEAAYKYFYLSLLASTFMLLAIGCLYVSYGTLNMADMAARIAAEGPRLLLLPGVVFLLLSFLI